MIPPQVVEQVEEVITPPQPPSTRSSILFALGQLSAQVQSQAEALKSVPDQVAASMLPKLTQMDLLLLNHGQRLDTIERRMYLVWGGGVVLVGLGGVILKFYPMLVH